MTDAATPIPSGDPRWTSPLVLAVDDEPGIRELLAAHLVGEGYRVLLAKDGEQGLELATSERPALVLLDIVMPVMDGFEALRQIRQRSMVPVILLTALGSNRDKIRGLDLGADDFITKPFNLAELSARVRAVLRRAQIVQPTFQGRTLEFGPLQVDVEQRRASVLEREIRLSPTEWSLLLQLCGRADQVVSHEELLPLVGGEEPDSHTQHLRVWISRLRNKLGDDPLRPRIIRTVPGVGYQIVTGQLYSLNHVQVGENA